MVAVISRIFGISHLELAEDIVQDSLLEALHRWSVDRVPDNPAAWLMQVAKRKTLNELKRRQMAEKNQPELLRRLERASESIDEAFLESEIKDSQLRMIFTCCHPDLPMESRIALTLKSLCGFSVKEIASALLTSTANINKRLYRAKVRFRDGSILLEMPPAQQLPHRLNAVYLCLYLLFNEGYHASHSKDLIRKDVCLEALRLTLLLESAFPDQAKIQALLALMFLHMARFEARLDDKGAIVTLEEQDRSRWDRQLIGKGLMCLQKGSRGSELSEYHLEAGIAAVHCMSASLEETNWEQIASQYEVLARIKPSPVIDFNRAIVLRWTKGPAAALQALLDLRERGELKSYNLLPASIATMHFHLGQYEQARASFQEAKALTHSLPQLELLERKIMECEAAAN